MQAMLRIAANPSREDAKRNARVELIEGKCFIRMLTPWSSGKEGKSSPFDTNAIDGRGSRL
jgi:hypothetical protein